MTGNPADYQIGSIQSRIAARAIIERIQLERERNAIIVTIEHIGRNDRDPLPPPRRVVSKGGITEIIHVAGSGS